MKRFSNIPLLSLLCLLPLRAEAADLSAGIREIYINPTALDYRSETMNRVKQGVFAQGFSSVTATLRLAMPSADSSYVFLPPLRSDRMALEVLAAQIAHARGRLILKPVISLNPGLGVARRLMDIRPRDTNLWFSTYRQALGVAIAASSRREVSELVVATGLHALFRSEYASNWIALLKDIRRELGTRVKLSFELSTDKELAAMRTWQNQDPSSFNELCSLLDVIRLGIIPVETTPGAGWTKDLLRQQLTDQLASSVAIFKTQSLTLSTVAIPAYRKRHYVENEVYAEPESTPDLKYQADGLSAFLAAAKEIPDTLRSRLNEIEFFEATTDGEPDPEKIDYSYLYYNPLIKDVLKQSQLLPPVTSFIPISQQPDSNKKVACLYYDQQDEKDILGAIHCNMLQNLLGAFPAWRAEHRKVSNYKSGDLYSCDATFYLASNFFTQPSSAFYSDAATYAQSRQLVWMNYKLQDFRRSFDQLAEQHGGPKLGFNVPKIVQPNRTPSITDQDPGFFRYFSYKNETFEKLARWDVGANAFSCDPALNLIQVTDPSRVQVLATARHSEQKDFTAPYVISQKTDSGAIWYIADLPFTFVHYEDRYLIFCDLLWDILKEKPPTGPPIALVRIEDVNSSQNQTNLKWIIDFLASRHLPFSLAVIPNYEDLFSDGSRSATPTYRAAYEYPDFIGTLRYAKARGADFVFHGNSHQAGDLMGGFDGVSGADYEFWLYPQNTPLPNDSSDYLIGELEKGEEVFNQLGIRPIAFELPHYASSALDSFLLGKLFQWNYHRSLYFDASLLEDAPLLPKHRMFECKTEECRKERRELARKLVVTADFKRFGGQVLPFVTWKDYYGQALIPETLGMIEYTFFNDDTWRRPVAHPADIVRRAKKLRTVRGAVASFFWHPDLLNRGLRYYQAHPGNFENEGGYKSIRTIVEGIQALGYEFKSISDCSIFPRDDCKK